ncbi:EDSAP-1 family PEP-CTERM protein [Rugamonas rubra]|uniref:PEP-CTERM protein-sorting domain-containing protein n=1 Tax=Rugamonas rubra TaxID=758825 RepID=A0A1I4L0R8_9BURK|nr:EDSAP-1 family PEP-CTERM protein [Rugamonas rubra]SFL84632.1 PEP-CTERM protein-sorting domain-containing protein [Rugamonas rubra]
MNKHIIAGTLMAVATLCLSTGAHARGVAETLLRVSNLKLSDSVGAAYTRAAFSALSTSNVTSNILYTGAPEKQIGVGYYLPGLGSVDLPTLCQQSRRNDCARVYSNYFRPFSRDEYSFPAGYDYLHADQLIKGDLIGNVPSTLSIDTRGDAAIRYVDKGYYGGASSVNLQMKFKLASENRLTLSFDADAYSNVYGFSPNWDEREHMESQIRFGATLMNKTTGATVFSYAPEEINFGNDPEFGQVVLDPAAKSFSITSALLNTSDDYVLSITQMAGSFARISAIPEPSGAAMLGAGIGLLAFLRRRSRTASVA